MRIYVKSLGCKLNQSEMDSLAERFSQRGHQVVSSPVEADLCVLNTCAVTHVAAQKSRQALRRLHRESPQASLVATGCYAELTPGDLCELPGVALVVGNQGKERLEELIGVEMTDDEQAEGTPHGPLPLPRSRTRALVKIQDGCDNACAYCIIHVARGPQHSRPEDQILDEIRARLAAGHQEIVLTGVHIGAYGQDRHSDGASTDLWTLVDRILVETGVPRLRLSSIEPWDLEERAFRLWDDARLCRHLHLPLQSGCDATLRRMARRYTTAEFEALVKAARAAIPDLAVTTDVIVGFPGETDGEFAQGLSFVQTLGFARVHVFPYSLRAGTAAAKLPDHVPPPLKAERARAMRGIASASEHTFQQKFIGRTFDVLWEASREERDGSLVWSGLTDNYLRVQTLSSADLTNTITSTRLCALVNGSLQGEL
ncbi:MAG TPA: tRNA (N(6)-L-threonylcarbamoyladenosine(37)-C(2))-methylthiotransferase MtaB [Anaerolineae bacterium]|nr:tRNA (N(6)-L-threonylcarbamoyladenosine(37)-C(2))-methylthiotransferase MtaB [Anaerolineae bacterium]